jgi:hypothetical protein
MNQPTLFQPNIWTRMHQRRLQLATKLWLTPEEREEFQKLRALLDVYEDLHIESRRISEARFQQESIN